LLDAGVFTQHSFSEAMDNKYYAPEFTTRFIQHCMPLTLLWSILACQETRLSLRRGIAICGNFVPYVIPFCEGDFGCFSTNEAEYSKFHAKKLCQHIQVKPSSISSNAENQVFVVFSQQCLFLWEGQTFEKHNGTQGVMENSQQELKHTRLENKKCKDLSTLQCNMTSTAKW